MKRLFLIVVLFGAMASIAIAHNAKIATYTLRDTGTGWFIEMNFAQTAIDAQMLKLYDSDELIDMSTDEYKKLFLKYLSENFHLRVDGEKVEFISGGILLGSHQTDVKFVLPEIPDNPEQMSIYLPMFEDIYNQTNLFRIYRGGGNFTKFFLSADNNFIAHMEFTDQGIVAIEKEPVNRLALVSGISILIIGIGTLFFLLRRKLKNSQLSKA